MPHVLPGVLLLVFVLFAPAQPRAGADLTITDRVHHLRSGVEREWAEFAERAEGRELSIAFEAKANRTEQTLRLRHKDLKQPWRVLLNGKEIAKLPFDEADMLTYWAVAPGTLADGRNELRIHSAGGASDDVLVGPAVLMDRPRAQMLSEATLDVSVQEAPGGRAVPARITVANAEGTLIDLGSLSGASQAVRPGVVYTRGERFRLSLPAGRYTLYAGRGFEYSVARAAVGLKPGKNPSVRLSIRREVDTTGWAALDTHLHTGTHARHGDADVAERMLTIAGEGIELPVSTEHNLRIDFDAAARDAGVRQYFTPILGSEVTTPSRGHFNVFPIAPAGRDIDHRAPDWQDLQKSMGDAASNPVVVLNHGRDVHGGFRPLDPTRHISVAGERLDGMALPANAMEIVNSGAVMSDAMALPRDWMGMLNRGLMLTPAGSSDSHDVSRYIVGQGRTYVRCDDRDPGHIDLRQATDGIRRGHAMVSYGLLAEVDVEGNGPGDLVTSKGPLNVRIRVKGPGWTRANRVALYVNGENVREEPIADGTKPGVKWEATWTLPRPRHDVHLVAVAEGPGVTEPYWPTAKPYQPTSIEFTPYVLGVSGAVFVDADGNGAFESAFEYARRLTSGPADAAALVSRLGDYDAAVAIQAASLLRAKHPSAFEATIRSVLPKAPAHVAKGLTAYLDAWKERSRAAVDFVDTSFENASPLWYDLAADGSVQIHLLYDHERESPNRAAGHLHFLLHGRPGARVTLEFRNLDNVWNGQPGSVARELKTLVISANGRDWTSAPTESLPDNRVRLTVNMQGPRLYVARLEPYRLSDLARLLATVRKHRSAHVETIGKTAGGHDLEILRIGDARAPYRVFVRARAHPWESGSNWVAQGLIQRLLKDDDEARAFLQQYTVYVLPMANKDGVERGRTRFNVLGKDLNRNWDRPADPQLSPENAALERWLEAMIAAGRKPHLAMELHNDGSGRLHISRPPVPQLDIHLARMATLENLLRQKTWFTEGSTTAAFRNSGTLGDGWLQRYGIDAVVHEFNCNWIAGLKDYPSARHWMTYGEKLAEVFAEYFKQVKP